MARRITNSETVNLSLSIKTNLTNYDKCIFGMIFKATDPSIEGPFEVSRKKILYS